LAKTLKCGFKKIIMIKKIIISISLLPILLLVEITSFTGILSLISAPYDIAVLAGFLCIGLYIIGNFYLVKYIYKFFKKTI